MRQLKVCMLGAYAVGKTSLVARLVSGVFSDRYLTTVGVKIDRKDVEVDGRQARLVLWDINGEDRFLKVQPSQVRGADGCLLVVDGTRAATLETAGSLRAMVLAEVGDIPMQLLVNKCDLGASWELSLEDAARALPGEPLATSAKTGESVEAAFAALTRQMLGG